MVILSLLGALLGACLGSFLNVVASRSLAGEPWGGLSRSHCPHCGRELPWSELIPLISFALQRGRCRGCSRALSWRYPAVEMVGALLGGAVWGRWGLSPWALTLGTVAAFSLFLNALTDLEEGVIFDLFALSPGALGLILRVGGGKDALIDGLLGAALGFGIIAIVSGASRVLSGQEGMGWGDASLMAGLGGLLGWKMTGVAFYGGIMAGGAVIIPMMILGKVHRKDAIPLGPFLALGGVASLLGGPSFLAWMEWAPGWPW